MVSDGIAIVPGRFSLARFSSRSKPPQGVSYLTHTDQTTRDEAPSADRPQCEIFAASTSTCSICGGSASNSDALAIRAAAIGPPRCDSVWGSGLAMIHVASVPSDPISPAAY